MIGRRVWPALLALLLGAAPWSGASASRPIVAWTYIVQSGDTISAIAARMGISPGDLARANAIGLDSALVPGTVLKRPGPDYTPNSHPRAPQRAPLPVRAAPVTRAAPPVRALPDLPPERRADPAAPRMIWPASGAVVARFGTTTHGKPDNGIDLAAFTGMAVYAAAGGKVIYAGTEPERFGQLIVIDHGGGWVTAYAYLGKVLITTGATVRKGGTIARIGATGEAKKPTLHFELRHDNVPQDPQVILPIRL